MFASAAVLTILGQLHWLPIAIFIVAYIFIAVESGRGSHLDRTAAAFCGAVAMVLFGVLSLSDAYRAVSWDTLLFLLGMMILVAHFQVALFFDWAAIHAAAVARTRFQLLAVLVFTAGILSAFFVNDTICLVFTPIVLAVTERLSLPKLPYLIALGTSANVGSVMSVTGNPQNALIGVTAHFTFLDFLAHLAPVALIGLAINLAVLAFFFRRDLWDAPLLATAQEAVTNEAVSIRLHKSLLTKCLLATALVLALWITNFPLALAAAVAGAFILIIGRVKSGNIHHRIDWELLLFFASLFVLMQGLQNSGAVNDLIQFFEPGFTGRTAAQLFSVSGTMFVLSNLVSNVPAVILMRPLVNSFPHAHFLWLAVASSSTLAGNATPISSIANLIVLQIAGRRERITFWEFTRVGIVVTVLTILAGIGILAVEAHFFSLR